MDVKLCNVKNISFQVIASPEGNSSILEVCDQHGTDFLHVQAVSEEEYEFRFFVSESLMTISLSNLLEIIEAAKKRVKYIDIDNMFTSKK